MIAHVFTFPAPGAIGEKKSLAQFGVWVYVGGMTKIDSHVPPPPRKSRRYPFRDMLPGQSVFYPGENKSDRQHPAYMAAKTLQKRHGLRFTLRSVVEDGVPGVRIWRVT